MPADIKAVIDSAKVNLIEDDYEAINAAKRKEVGRSFISDTMTVPTPEMLTYGVKATLGDDVYSEPSTIAFEAHVAKLFGKEAGIFMPSGTASNQIGIRCHLFQPPYSVLCDHRAHVYKNEVSGISYNSHAAVTPVIPSNGHHLTLEDVEEHFIDDGNIHNAPTALISLENTLNATIMDQKDIIAISDYAHSKGIKIHLDGARIWHVAVETGLSFKELADPFDSLSVCFSKGLGAPVGSMLLGPTDFIKRARRFRKLFGGGLRQIGSLAGCAAYALNHHLELLPAVHTLAERLTASLREIGADIFVAETCMVFYDPTPLGVSYDEIAERAAALPEPIVLGGSRLVLHFQTTEEAVTDFIAVVRELAEEKKKEGWVRPEQTRSNGVKDPFIRRAAVSYYPSTPAK